MKSCQYCGEDIQDKAVKCKYCHSVLATDTKEKSSENLADLVIKFVGAVSILGTVIASVFGYIGFKSMNDVKTLQTKATNLINANEIEINKLEEELKRQKGKRRVKIYYI
jgi:hypothetical protein